ncbi:MAG: NADase-type glycan-binding domain-containing protein [Chloroflexaceae bacterium]
MSLASIPTFIRSMLTAGLVTSLLSACGGAATPRDVQSLQSSERPIVLQDAPPRPTSVAAPTPMLERMQPTRPPVKLPATSVALPTTATASGDKGRMPIVAERTGASSASSAPAEMPAPAPLTPFAAFAFNQAAPGRDAAGNTVYYHANNTIDGYLDTAWRVPGAGIGESILVFFDRAVVLSEVWIVPGYAKVDPVSGENRFWQNRRVRKVRLSFSGDRWVEARLAEQPEFQPVRFEPLITSYVEITVLETTPPGPRNGRDFTPISEIAPIGQICTPRWCGQVGNTISELIGQVGSFHDGIQVEAIDETYTYARLWRIPLSGDQPTMEFYKRERGGWKWLTGGSHFDVAFLDVLKRLGVPKSIWP